MSLARRAPPGMIDPASGEIAPLVDRCVSGDDRVNKSGRMPLNYLCSDFEFPSTIGERSEELRNAEEQALTLIKKNYTTM